MLVDWTDVTFTEMELVDQYNQNIVQKAPLPANGETKITIAPGAIVTLTNVALNKVNRDGAKSDY